MTARDASGESARSEHIVDPGVLGSSGHPLEPSDDFRFGLQSDNAINFLSALEDQQSRDAAARDSATDVAGFSSTLILANRTRPLHSEASSSIMGAILWHGPHHAAHMSSNTGNGEALDLRRERCIRDRHGIADDWHRRLACPQIGFRPLAILSSGTRLVTPHEGQRINCVSGIMASLRASARIPLLNRAFVLERKHASSPRFNDCQDLRVSRHRMQ